MTCERPNPNYASTWRSCLGDWILCSVIWSMGAAMRNFRADGFPKMVGLGYPSGWVEVSSRSRTMQMPVADAIRLMAELQTAALAADDTGETRALLRSTLANMLEAMDGDRLAMETTP